MYSEIGTFELRDNDIMMRELSSAETNEVAGGQTGTAIVSAFTQSAAGSSIVATGSFTTATSGSTALASVSLTSISPSGTGNILGVSALALVG